MVARIHPGSALSKESPDWIVAAELVRTSRLFARSAAAINPDWLVELASHVVQKSWVNPHWSRKSGTVLATEQVRLYGFLVSDGIIVPYGPVQPGEAREIFIRCALVDQDLPTKEAFSFLLDNKALVERLGTMEEKLRRRDLVAGEDAIVAFYAANLPSSVLDLGTLNRYLREHGDSKLRMQESDLLTGIDTVPNLTSFPDSIKVAGDQWSLSYHFDPDSNEDGVTLKVPSGRLSDLGIERLDWMVPGLLTDKVEALIRGLPKNERRKLIPIAETVREALAGMDRTDTDLPHALSVWLYKERQVDIRPDMWNHDTVPKYLKMRLSLVDATGKEIASGRDAENLSAVTAPLPAGGKTAEYRKKMERDSLREFPETGVPEQVRISESISLYPALVPEEESVALRYLADKSLARSCQLSGQAELARMHWVKEIRGFRKSLALTGNAKAAAMFLGGAAFIEESLWRRVLADLFASLVVRDVSSWENLLKAGGAEIYSRAETYQEMISRALIAYGNVRQTLNTMAQVSYRKVFIEERFADIDEIMPNSFVTDRSVEEWEAYPRWLEAVAARVRRAEADPSKDEKARRIWQPLYELWNDLSEGMPLMASDTRKKVLKEAYIMIQELRVALFAVGEVRPLGKVSESKVLAKLEEVRRIL